MFSSIKNLKSQISHCKLPEVPHPFSTPSTAFVLFNEMMPTAWWRKKRSQLGTKPARMHHCTQDFPGSWLRKSFDRNLSNYAWNNAAQEGKGLQFITWPLEKLWGCPRVTKKRDIGFKFIHPYYLYCTICRKWWDWTECLPFWILPRELHEVWTMEFVSFKPLQKRKSRVICYASPYFTNKRWKHITSIISPIITFKSVYIYIV